jgi:pimeloyl-ACP methyl ester carboxylesterase
LRLRVAFLPALMLRRRARGRDQFSPTRELGRRQENQPYDWSPQNSALEMPRLIIVGYADSVILEQTVELFRLLGGVVLGDFDPLPNVQLAVIPGTAHSALLTRSELLSSVISPFLEASVSGTESG